LDKEFGPHRSLAKLKIKVKMRPHWRPLFEQRRRDGDILQFNYFNVGNLQSGAPLPLSIALDSRLLK